MKGLMFSALLFFMGGNAFAIDSTIRVLGVHTSAITSDHQKSNAQLSMLNLREAWINSGMPLKSGVTIDILNGGNTIPLNASVVSPVDSLAELNAAKLVVGNTNLRSLYDADIIIVYDTFIIGACGVADSPWLDSVASHFEPNSNNLDLRGSNIDYVGMVSVNCDDTPTLTSHEFGHLLGGAHHRDSIPSSSRPHPGLYSDSHGWTQIITSPSRFQARTAITNDVICDPEEDFCFVSNRYSDNVTNYGNGSNENARALAKTAKSVANYFIGEPSPVLKAPINVGGIYWGCGIDISTLHTVLWDDGGSTAVTTRFEMWGQGGHPPLGSHLDFAPDVFSSRIYVYGGSVLLRMRACAGSTCSALSDSSYYAIYDSICDGSGY